MGHPPFGHAGEDAARPLPARALRHRLPPQRAVAADRGGAEPDRGGARRHPHAHGRRRSRQTLEGKIVRLVDRVAYINHDIDDAIRWGLLDAGRPAAGRDRPARRDRLEPDRHARARPDRDLRARRRHRPERGGRRGDAGAPLVHVRARLPRRARPRRARARARDDRADLRRTSSSAATRRTRSALRLRA